MMLTAYPALCSALMGMCKNKVHKQCCYWLATRLAFTMKVTAWPWDSKWRWMLLSTH